MNYYCFTLLIQEEWQKELIIAALDEIGFDGYEERADALDAFIATDVFNEAEFLNAIASYQENFGFTFSRSVIEEKNWNEIWESNFQPIIINSEVAVRASFHTPPPDVKYDLIIDPKMSFGTGHHATTEMMMRLMLQENFSGKNVLDFGCGTGILSILASKLNAVEILSIDHEQWAYYNALENFQLNNVKNAVALLNDAMGFEGGKFHIILANINLSIIVNNMSRFANAIKGKGKLLISGFLLKDEAQVLAAAAS